MAYIKGDEYIWTGVAADEEGNESEYAHFWTALNREDVSDWGRRYFDENGDDMAGGVAFSQEVIDQFVMMRFAEIVRNGNAEEVIERAAQVDNFGAMCLRNNRTQIIESVRQMRLESVPERWWESGSELDENG